MNRDTFTINLSSPWTTGEDEIRAPATLLTVGEHCGSHGCRRYSEDVLRRSASAWDGVPVTWSHPMDETGPISVQAKPEAVIGYLSNPYYEDGRLKATIHVTDERARTLVQATRNISAGMFIDEEDGDHVTAMTPDHLAVLSPDEQPACDWASGCGIRAHSTTAMREAAREVIVERTREAMTGLATLPGGEAMKVSVSNNRSILVEPGDRPAAHGEPDEVLLPGGADPAASAEPDVLMPTSVTEHQRQAERAERQRQHDAQPGHGGPEPGNGDEAPGAPLLPTGVG